MRSPAIDETQGGSILSSKIADLRHLVNDTGCANVSLVPPALLARADRVIE